MKAVFRVRSWSIERHDGFADLRIRCSSGLVGTTVSNVLKSAFPGLNPVYQREHGLAALDGDTLVRCFGEIPPTEELESFLTLLTSVLTVCDSADASHCIGIYRIPVDETPNDDWPYTEIGSLVHNAKYQGKTTSANEIAKEMALVIAAHPALRSAQAVASMPSTGRHLDAPLVWRKTLARHFGFEEIILERTRAVTPQKDINDRAERVQNQQESMRCTTASEKSVIILDDLYMDGATMDEAVRALRAGGASQVLALCAVKTARGTQGGVGGLVNEHGGD